MSEHESIVCESSQGSRFAYSRRTPNTLQGRTLIQNASVGASRLSFEAADATFDIFISTGHTATFTHDVSLRSALMQQPIALERFAPRSSHPRAFVFGSANRSAASIAVIKRQLDEESIEDGITHRAEQTLKIHISKFGEDGLLTAIKSSMSASAASLTKLFGRCAQLSLNLQSAIVSHGLSAKSVELRDAAVQAAENWGDTELVPMLLAHRDPVDWLNKYAADVARDLEG